MKITGQILKKNRESKNISIQEVASVLKISSKIITSIEDADMSKLPPKTFVRGFVRSYATYLKLDVDDILKTYHEEMGSTHPVDHNVPTQDENNNTSEEKFLPWKISLPFLKEKSKTTRYIVLGSIVALIGIILSVKNVVDKYEKERTLLTKEEIAATTGIKIQEKAKLSPVTTPTQEAETSIPEKDNNSKRKNSIVQKDQDHKKTDNLKNNDVTKKNNNLNEKKKIIKEESLDKKKSEVQAPPKRQMTPEKIITTETVKKEDLKKTALPVKATPQEVIVEALDHIEITFYVDNGKKESVILRPDDIHTFKGKNSIKLEVSDAGAINIIHNGRDRGVPGNIGEEKVLRYQ